MLIKSCFKPVNLLLEIVSVSVFRKRGAFGLNIDESLLGRN